MAISFPAPSIPTLCDFRVQHPRHQVEQGRSLDWLAEVHAASEQTSEKLSEPE
jgi:hypothetical protein